MIKNLHTLWVIAMVASFFVGCEKQEKLPNIVFYITDDQSQLDCSVYGNELIRTPNNERLACTGITFENTYVAEPACAPSRAPILTGLTPSRNGAEENHSYPKPCTLNLIENLQDRFYKVLSFGKIAHYKYSEKIGFDHYDEDVTNLIPHIADFFRSNKSIKPICLLVGDRRPHVPWTTDEIFEAEEFKLPAYLIDTQKTKEHRAEYYSDSIGANAEMGQVYEFAKKRFGDNLIFIFSANHGGQWSFGKSNLYDAGTKVPLVMVLPIRIPPNTRTNAIVSWVDVFPTLLDLVSAETPPNLDEEPFNDVALNDKEEHRRYIYTTHSGDGYFNIFPLRSIAYGKYKYIKNLYPHYYHSNHCDILRKEHAVGYWNAWDTLAKKDSVAVATVKKYYLHKADKYFDLNKDSNEQVNLIHSTEHAEHLGKNKNLLNV